jgi:hypothetical protein
MNFRKNRKYLIKKLRGEGQAPALPCTAPASGAVSEDLNNSVSDRESAILEVGYFPEARLVHICLLTASHFLRWLTQQKASTMPRIEYRPVSACSHNLFAAYEHEFAPGCFAYLGGVGENMRIWKLDSF